MSSVPTPRRAIVRACFTASMATRVSGRNSSADCVIARDLPEVRSWGTILFDLSQRLLHLVGRLAGSLAEPQERRIQQRRHFYVSGFVMKMRLVPGGRHGTMRVGEVHEGFELLGIQHGRSPLPAHEEAILTATIISAGMPQGSEKRHRVRIASGSRIRPPGQTPAVAIAASKQPEIDAAHSPSPRVRRTPETSRFERPP